ncbi:hypothetical protein AMTRI_Chr02g263050 [Amborella trichopoda]
MIVVLKNGWISLSGLTYKLILLLYLTASPVSVKFFIYKCFLEFEYYLFVLIMVHGIWFSIFCSSSSLLYQCFLSHNFTFGPGCHHLKKFDSFGGIWLVWKFSLRELSYVAWSARGKAGTNLF